MSDAALTVPILIVEDDPTFAQTLKWALAKRGQVAVLARTQQEALLIARESGSDRAVVDLRLGDENGVEVVRALREEHPQMKILVLTGYGTIQTAVLSLKAGALEYLTKPASAEQILAALDADSVSESDPSPTERAPSLDDVEREHLSRVLADSGGNISEAARRLGMHRRSLQRKLGRHGL